MINNDGWRPELSVDARRLASILYGMRITGPISIRYSVSFFEDNRDVFMVTSHVEKDGRIVMEQTIILPASGWQEIINYGFELARIDGEKKSQGLG